jgi:hypothetical protein
MSYPDNCIRGISSPNFIIQGMVGSGAFLFEDKNRQDGWTECSVNWEDDDDVVNFTLSQTNTNGSLKFKGGALSIPLTELERLKSLPPISGLLSFERAPFDGNQYHGNILLKAGTGSPVKNAVLANLALASGAQLYSIEG